MTGRPTRPRVQDLVAAGAVGLALAGVAGLGVGAAFAGGLIAIASTKRRPIKDTPERDAEGRLLDWPGLLRSVQRGGVAPELRAELWPLLLGVFPPGANEDERLAVVAGLHKQYIKLVRVCAEMEKQVAAAKQEQQQQQQRWEEGGATPEGAAVANAPEPEPLPAGLASFVEAHRVAVLDAVRTSFPQQPLEGRDGGGGEFGPAAAALGSPTVTVLPVAVVDGLPEYVFVERPAAPEPGPEPGGAAGAAAPQPAGQHGAAASAGSSGDDMHGNMPLWTSALAAEALEHATHVPGPAKRQMLRLINLLTAYAIHDPEVAYCQGMSDLAAAFITVFDGDDALAFACFERLMRTARRNFLHCETGIKQQLRELGSLLQRADPALYRQLQRLGSEDCMFAYRMVLVMLRRELKAEEALTLWEIGWAREQLELAEGQEAAGVAAGSGASGSRGMARQRSGSSSGSGGALASLTAPAAGAEQSAGSGSGRASPAGGGLLRPGSASSFRGGAAPAPARGAGGGGGSSAAGTFQLCFIAAVVRAQRWKLMHQCRDSDDVLRLFNTIDIDFFATLDSAEKLQRRCELGRAVLERL